MVNLSVAEPAVDLLWRQKESEEFKSTGLMDYINPDTGRRMPKTTVQLPIQDGDVQLEAMYVTPTGLEMGPFDLSFNALELGRSWTKEILDEFWTNWVGFRDFGGKHMIYFTHILSYRLAVKTIRYKLGDDESWLEFPFQTVDTLHGAFGVGSDQQIYITCPATTGRIRVQVEYYDGTWSAVNEYQKSPGGN